MKIGHIKTDRVHILRRLKVEHSLHLGAINNSSNNDGTHADDEDYYNNVVDDNNDAKEQ